MSRRTSQSRRAKKLAKERVRILWTKAEEIVDTRPDLAKRWIAIAKKIAQKARMKTPRSMNRRICKNCGILLIPGRTCRVRVRHNRSTHLTVTCLSCNAIRRFTVRRQG